MTGTDDRWDEPFDPRPADACEEAEALALLDASTEATPEERERLAAHRAACARCAADGPALEEAAGRVADALRAAGPTRDLSSAVLARIRADGPAPAPRIVPREGRRLPRRVLVAAAAAVLLLSLGVRPVLSGRWWWSGGGTRPPGEGAAEDGFAAFADATSAAGLGFRHHAPADRLTWMAESVGSGVAASDLDGDGRPDLFFPDAWGLDEDRPAGAGCRLYLNRGDSTFEDATARAGIDVPERVFAAVAADLDDDGRRDLVLSCYGAVRVLRNMGGARFEDATAASGLSPEPGSWFTGVAAADFDRDGVLDLFVARYADQEGYRAERRRLGLPSGREGQWRGLPVFAGPKPLAPQTARLFRGLGGCRFADASASLEGLVPRYGFQCVATDADGDGWIDVYVANDMDPNDLWRNQGGMRFRNLGIEAGCAFDGAGKAQAGMGVAAGDFEGDGLPDLVVTNFSHDHLTLYANGGRPARPSFADRSYPSGVGKPSFPYLGWGVVLEDLDLDGAEDLVVADGHLYPNVAEMTGLGAAFAEPLMAFRGLGGGAFEDRTGRVRGLGGPRAHRGLATLDYDADGRPDLVASTAGGAPVLLRNVTAREGRAWAAFRLTGGRSPRDPAGARVTVTAGGRTQSRELHLGDSFESCSEPVLRFGLGSATQVDRAVVRWPSGETQDLGPLPASRVHEVVEGR